MVKLFIPVKSEGTSPPKAEELNELQIETRFGRTPYYLLYDTTTKDVKFLPNENHHFDGDVPPFELALRNHADGVLASHLGYKPYQGFKDRGIPIYQADPNKSIMEAVISFNTGHTSLLGEPAEGTCCSNH